MKSPLKSMIDWNEIVPRLPKAKREDLYLEAVAILSAAEPPEPRYIAANRRYRSKMRLWKAEHPNELLADKCRRYSINREMKGAMKVRANSGCGRVWTHLLNSKNDSITYEGLASLAKGQKLQPASLVSALWSKRLIDVEGLNAAG